MIGYLNFFIMLFHFVSNILTAHPGVSSAYFAGTAFFLLHFSIIYSWNTTAEGNTKIVNKKTMKMTIPAKIPKLLTGMMGLKKLAKKAAAVVEEVTSMAFDALLKE